MIKQLSIDGYVYDKNHLDIIKGITVINNQNRKKLNLTMNEYAMMDAIDTLKRKSKPISNQNLWVITGFEDNEQSILISALKNKGFLADIKRGDQTFLAILPVWLSQNIPFEQEFEEFWTIKDSNGKSKVAWPGSKPDAKKKYITVRKFYSKEFMFSQRDTYFELLRKTHELTKFKRQKLMCTVFLNPETERFKENYKEQLEELIKEYTPQIPEKKREFSDRTMNDHKKDFS